MLAFFTAVIGFFITILEFIAKRFGVHKVVIGIQIAVTTIFTTFLLTAMAYFFKFVVKMWTTFVQLVNDMKTLGISAEGVAYSISNSKIVSSFWAFMHASGLDDAFITAGTLFISLLSFWFAIRTYQIVIFVYRDVHRLITQLLDLLAR